MQASGAGAYQAGAGITPEREYLEITPKAGVGVFINTNGARAFVVKRDVDASKPGRVAVRCYDEKGNVLNEGGYVKGLSNMAFFYSSGFGGVYNCSDSDADAYFSISPQVKKIAVIVTGGKGGGRPDMAQGGTKDVEGIDKSIASVVEIVKQRVKS